MGQANWRRHGALQQCSYLSSMSFHPDMGNVPSWIGAGSLLLAFRIFLKDRSRSDRVQVDAVGIWGGIDRHAVLGGPRNDNVKVQIHIRNATELPIEVQLVAFTFQTRWGMPVGDDVPDSVVRVRQYVPGKADSMRFMGPVGIAPQTTWDGAWVDINLTHTAPADDAELYFFSDGVKCVIAYSLITDNAGRRWEARQRQGKPAKRIRWYSRSGAYYPMEWQNRVGRKFRIFKVKAKDRTRNIRKRPDPGGVPKGPDTISTPISR